MIATPHLGANTIEAQTRVAEEIAEQFIDMAKGEPLFGVVNVPALSLAGTTSAKPWIQLASSLGILAFSQASNVEKPLAVKITLKGISIEYNYMLSSYFIFYSR